MPDGSIEGALHTDLSHASLEPIAGDAYQVQKGNINVVFVVPIH